jgi:hypothetical protein
MDEYPRIAQLCHSTDLAPKILPKLQPKAKNKKNPKIALKIIEVIEPQDLREIELAAQNEIFD